jgi:hypothetical protein
MRARIGLSVAVSFSILLASSWLLPPKRTRTVNADSVGRIVPTGDTVEPRFDHTATLLPNGKVLIAAGMARNGLIEPTAELYDPHTGKFVSVGKMQSPRARRQRGTIPPVYRNFFSYRQHAFRGCVGACSAQERQGVRLE